LPNLKKESIAITNNSNHDSSVTVNEIPSYEVRLIKNVFFEDLLKKYGRILVRFVPFIIGGH